jgi:enamine deaminase RidA (YjgF/YER057c/UK114 family)
VDLGHIVVARRVCEPPGRLTTVQAALPLNGFKVEIRVIAGVPD